MKITVLIPDNLIEEVKDYTKGKNITESLIKKLPEPQAESKILIFSICFGVNISFFVCNWHMKYIIDSDTGKWYTLCNWG